jgi:crossover junction endodeoxyribonuclease RuvC
VSRIVGIDPGLSGAAALLDGEELVDVFDFAAADGRLLSGIVADWLDDRRPHHVVIEGVHSMPQQGVASTFKFGRAFGTIEGVVAALRLPSSLISPAHWKRVVGVTRDKASARALACRRWPEHRGWFERVKDDGRAEAALIALAYVKLNVPQQSDQWVRQATTMCNNPPHATTGPAHVSRPASE